MIRVFNPKFKKIILFLLVNCLSYIPTYAQTLQATETKALLTVLVVNYEKKILEGETVTFIATKDKKSYRGTTDENGKFQILIPKGDKYLVQYKEFATDRNYNTLDVSSTKGLIELEYTLSIESLKIYTLNNVFFDLGKSILKPESAKELNELVEYLLFKKKMKIEIAGHTDNSGDKTANQKLSEDRANAVRNYLMGKGIASERIIAKGYGDTQPIGDNNVDTGKQKNRRTEVRIIKEENNVAVIKATIQKQIACSGIVFMKGIGILQNKELVKKRGYSGDYAINRPPSICTLDSIVNFLTINTTQTITIVGHVAEGKDELTKKYEQTASESLATMVKTFLVGHKIDPQRIKTRGMGSSQLLFKNEEDHKLNDMYSTNRNDRVEIINSQ